MTARFNKNVTEAVNVVSEMKRSTKKRKHSSKANFTDVVITKIFYLVNGS